MTRRLAVLLAAVALAAYEQARSGERGEPSPPGLDDLQSLAHQLIANGPLIDSLDAEGWGPANPNGVRLIKAIYEVSAAVDAYLAP